MTNTIATSGVSQSNDSRVRNRQAGRDFINSDAGAAAAEALGAFVEAIRAEREVEADKARAVEQRAGLQAAALAALRALMLALCAIDLLRRRMVTFTRNQKEGTFSHAHDLDSLLKPARLRTAAGRKTMRKMLARALLDLGVLPGKAGGALASALNLADGGRNGPFGDDGVFDADPAAGVKPDSGAAYTLQIKLAYAAGYTAGANGAPESRRLAQALLAQAVRTFNVWRASLGAADRNATPAANLATVRDWCARTHRDRSDAGYTQGCADRAAKRIERSKKLLG